MQGDGAHQFACLVAGDVDAVGAREVDDHGGVCGEREEIHRRDGVYGDADRFDERVVADDVLCQMLARGDDFLADALGEFARKDAGV